MTSGQGQSSNPWRRFGIRLLQIVAVAGLYAVIRALLFQVILQPYAGWDYQRHSPGVRYDGSWAPLFEFILFIAAVTTLILILRRPFPPPPKPPA